MPFVPAANTVMVELRQRMEGQEIENVLYFSNAAGFGPTDMANLGDAILTWWTGNMAALLSGDLDLTEIFLTDLRTATSPTVTFPVPPDTDGDVGDDAVPNNCALCLSFRTSGRGRSSRGRNYIAGIPESSVQNSTVSDTVVTALVDAYSALPAAVSPLGWVWVVVSRFTGGAARSAALVQPITAVLAVDPVIDSQRRRLPGRGR